MAEITPLGLSSLTEPSPSAIWPLSGVDLLSGASEPAFVFDASGSLSLILPIWQNPAFRAAPSYPQYPSWRRPARVVGPV